MKGKKKKTMLLLFVILIIFVLLFSVIGIVVLYLGGNQNQQIQVIPSDAVDAPIEILQEGNTIQIGENTGTSPAENPTTINDIANINNEEESLPASDNTDTNVIDIEIPIDPEGS